jgi:drug/metabolite transporter (DMT)-like permease
LFLIPIVALVLGVVVRGERVAILSVVGAAVCLAGAAMLRRPSQGSAKEPQMTAASVVSACDRSITVPLSEC